jgi:hypothetical protein
MGISSATNADQAWVKHQGMFDMMQLASARTTGQIQLMVDD